MPPETLEGFWDAYKSQVKGQANNNELLRAQESPKETNKYAGHSFITVTTLELVIQNNQMKYVISFVQGMLEPYFMNTHQCQLLPIIDTPPPH